MTKSFSSMEKKAAFEALLEHGYDFDTAVEAIEKEAGLLNQAGAMAKKIGAGVKGYGIGVKYDASQVGNQVRNIGTAFKANAGVSNLGQLTKEKALKGIKNSGSTVRALAKNKAVQLGAGAVAAGTGAAIAARQQEKQACMDKLLAEGVDFSTAVELVKQAEQEIYGE